MNENISPLRPSLLRFKILNHLVGPHNSYNNEKVLFNFKWDVAYVHINTNICTCLYMCKYIYVVYRYVYNYIYIYIYNVYMYTFIYINYCNKKISAN